MTDKHIFHDHTTLVVRSLKGMVATHPHLSLIPSLKVVYHANHDPSKVSLICGGGSGHEPGTVGFVGYGLLAASVAGDVFASPSARQVFGGIKAVPSDKGTILIITNCQGLKNVELVVVGDDVSVPRSRGNMVGRRCLAGITLEDLSFQDLVDLGRSVSTNTASICAALDHCHVPGRSGEFSQIPEGTVEIGLGLHNETGVFNIPQPSAEELIKRLLDLLLNQEDPERAFVKFKKNDALILLVNNQGGMSALEMGAVVDETLNQLVFNGPFMGSMNMPGISLSLLNLTNVVDECSFMTVDHLVTLIDAPHGSVSWPSNHNLYPVPEKLKNRKRADMFTEVEKEEKVAFEGPSLKTSSSTIQAALHQASVDVVALEPDLTRWDTSLKEGLGSDGDLVALFRALTEIIDDSCGGTLGAIFSIYLAGMTTSIITAASSKPAITPQFFGRIAVEALETLQQRTAARVGHRTVMDALIPFAETLAKTGSLVEATKACRNGGEGTSSLKAKLGRATYVGEREDGKPLPPDPGAMALVAVVEGICKACS
ncbi:hypothetical protein P7C73_g4632, partial [Tremellales sp. Uapishka_1]